jgi:translation elongation factor EF-Tu-like GTPase
MVIPLTPTINASVTFLPPSEGGRSVLPHNSNLYRPHLVVGDVNQRMPIVAGDGRTILEDYLGVCFTGNGEAFTPGESCEVTLRLAYHPEVNYDQLKLGSTFTIREGGKIVGFGVVTSRTP